MKEKRYVTISELNRYLKNKFDTDTNLQKIYLKGEISNFKGHTRGHLYFTLKDETSRLNAVMFSYQAANLKFVPEDGMKVLIEGKISVYEASGNYQVYVDKMENEGLGDLFQQFEELKKKLAAEGLFKDDHKISIPKYPNRIGVITAPTGAAVKDIISTVKRRYPIAEIIIFPSLVQGSGAAPDLVKQLEIADTYNLDVIIFGRGGGSIEDLWSFNEEIVARAIYKMQTPIISAVGHEIDFTISDFVADLRAPTPTGAAEMAVPNIIDVNNHLNNLMIRSNKFIDNKIKLSEHKLAVLKRSYALSNPLNIYEAKEQKLSLIIDKIQNFMHNKLNNLELKYNNLISKQVLTNPKLIIQDKQNEYEKLLEKITLLNPLNILNKGYAMVKKDDEIIKSIKSVKKNDELNIKVYEGSIISVVKEVKE
ncbi:MAG: exodeoxyribonuclease VII large subunit [Mollicutes bacterium]|jgi:exodeoxyribonuclease VII large subunit|nr:exodeoxyribonuclease VII large subunit [Mollicutes bacterium]